MNVVERSPDVAIEQALIQGNLEGLSIPERLALYNQTCKSLGLNPLTKPFEYIKLNGKLTLYAKRDATDQLRKINHVSVVIKDRVLSDGVFIVTAQATIGNRSDESIGAVPVKGLQGDMLANAIMKAETKAKRRVTLSICGLGFLDESELESVTELKRPQTIKPQPILKPQASDEMPGYLTEMPPPPEDVVPFIETISGRAVPSCCGKPMMISKFDSDTWYCTACRTKQAM